MRSSKNKVILSTTLLIAVFAFLYFFTGVFGDTRINLTLRTNPDLEDGLVAHYTFDGDPEVGTYAFATAGATTSDLTSQSDGTDQVLVDADHIYIVGVTDQCTSGTTCWNYLKLDKVTGNYDPVFGGGEATSTFTNTNGNEAPFYSQVDDSYVYGAGDSLTNCTNGGLCGRIEKHDKVTGDFVSAFGDGGAVITDPTTSDDNIYDIKLDGNYIYVAVLQGANCTNGGTCWRYEKRRKDTGALVTAFGTNGAVESDPGSNDDALEAIAVDNKYIYGAGYSDFAGGDCDTNDCGYIEKRDKETGQLVTSFGTGGATTTNLTNGEDRWHDIKVDDSYIYVAGYGNGAGGNGYRGLAVAKLDKTTGDPVTAFDSDGIVAVDASGGEDNLDSIEIDDTYLYTSGYISNCNTTDRCWHMQKINKTTGAFDTSFGDNGSTTINRSTSNDTLRQIVIDNKYIYLAGNQGGGCPNGGSCIGIEKRYKSDGSLVDTTSADAVTLIGGAHQVPGNIGQGIEFDGVDDYMEIYDGRVSSASQGTISAWVRLNTLADGQTVVGYGGGDVGTPGLFGMQVRQNGAEYDLGVIQRTDGGSVDVVRGNTSLSTDKWHHLVVVSDGSSYSIYVDGSPEALTVTSGSNQGDWFGDTTVAETDKSTIGAMMFDGSMTNFIDGIIDDVRIYDRALSAQEISRLYDLGATTHINTTITSNPDLENGLIAHWTFDASYMDIGSSTGEVLDSSGNGLIGNMENFSAKKDNMIPGVIGQAVEFDANDDTIRIHDTTDSFETAPLTIAFWTYLNSTAASSGDWYRFMGKTGNGTPPQTWMFYVPDSDASGRLFFRSGETGNPTMYYIRSDDTMPIREWVHVVGIIDGNYDTHLYVNGVKQSESADMSSLGDTNYELTLGEATYQDTIDGALDDVRIYDRVLSDDEIQRLYELGATTHVNKTLATNPDLENGLIAHYTFDGPDVDISSTTAEVRDSSGNGHSGDMQSFGTEADALVPGKIGQALTFDGNNDKIYVWGTEDDFETPPLTIAFWTKMYSLASASGDWYRWIGKQNSVAPWYSWLFYQPHDTDRINFGTSSSSPGSNYLVRSNDIPPLNEWYHVVGVIDGSLNVRLYINGVQQSETDSLPSLLDSDQILEIGQSNNQDTIDGLMDDVRIYDRVLSDDEIRRLYQLGR